MQALSTAKSGERYTIKWMLGNQKVMDFLHRHDFCEGNPCLLYTSPSPFILPCIWKKLPVAGSVARKVGKSSSRRETG